MTDNKKYPDSIKVLLAEEIRQEKNNKLSLLGIFAGDDILLNDEPGKALPALVVYAVFRGGKGKSSVKTNIFSPNKEKEIFSRTSEVIMKENQNMIVAFKLTPFEVPAFGKYSIEWIFDNSKKYSFEFEIKKGSLQG